MGGPREPAYDNPLDEGRPLYAPANGVVITNGSRVRDVSQFGCGGTPNQGEIYVKTQRGLGARRTAESSSCITRMCASGSSSTGRP